MGYCETHALHFVHVRHCPRCPEPDRSWVVRGVLMYRNIIPGRHPSPKRRCDVHGLSFDKPGPCRACLGLIPPESIEAVLHEQIDDLLREVGG